MIALFALLVSGVFTYFMPQLIWNVTFGEVIELLNTDGINKFFEILKKLGMADKTPHEAGTQMLITSIGIGIAIFIAVFVILKIIIKRKKN